MPDIHGPTDLTRSNEDLALRHLSIVYVTATLGASLAIGLALWEQGAGQQATTPPQPTRSTAQSSAPRTNVGQFLLGEYGQSGVPRLYHASLPEDISTYEVNKKKQSFVNVLLPLILNANEHVAKDKALLASLLAKSTYSRSDEPQLRKLATHYKLRLSDEGPITPADIEELKLRVDMIPPSLALAQGAIESGWGTSRFARLGNALYGEWVWGDSENGIVPKGRESGKTHRIRAFDALQGSVTSYIRNLNTHPAYKELREHRANLKANGEQVTGTRLAYTLIAYSTRREAYVKDLKSIIRRNGFEKLDGLGLRASGETQTTP